LLNQRASLWRITAQPRESPFGPSSAISKSWQNASIGIDVGGMKTRLALFDSDFEVVHEIKEKTPQELEDFETLLAESVEELKKAAVENSLTIVTAGIDSPVGSTRPKQL
jgi:predicted NBD/HSP70 family sugar kinase